jgi:hypothetical protein
VRYRLREKERILSVPFSSSHSCRLRMHNLLAKPHIPGFIPTPITEKLPQGLPKIPLEAWRIPESVSPKAQRGLARR